MFGMSLSHLVLLTLVIFILFGAGKLPQVMSDLAKGLRAFKEGFKEPQDDQTIKSLKDL